jgi:hypothetical protein
MHKASSAKCKQKLIDDSVDKNDRESIISDIFGDNGLVNADDSICFDEQIFNFY